MKFVVEVSASFSDGIVDLSSYLTTFVVASDYNTNNMPMWSFSFRMPYSIKKTLQEGDFTLPFRVYSIKTSQTEDDDPYNTGDDFIYDELVYEDEIIEYSKTFSNVKQVTDETEQEDNALETIPFSVAGLSKGIIEVNSSILNGNYRNSNSISALKASMQDLNSKVKIITNNDTLTKTYKQLIIPPMNLIPAVKHVINNYPIYSTRTGVFFSDKENLHIFTDTDKSLKTRIDVDIVENSQEIQYDPKDFVLSKVTDNYYSYKTMNTPVFDTVKKINDNLLGIDKVVFTYDDIFNLNTSETTDRNNIYEKKRIYWDNLSEESTTNIIEDRYRRNTKSSLSFVNVDPRIFDQYTYINIDGEDTVAYLKGRYVVKSKAEIYTSLSTTGGSSFSNEITVVIENSIE